VIVVDASVLATALGDDGPDGDRARARLRGERLSAPELIDLEVDSVLRRQVQQGAVDVRRAALALADLAAVPLRRAPHRPLLARCWELRDNVTVYDASYVALAEALDVTLLTGDGRLARAPGLRCRVEMLRSAHLCQLLQTPCHAALHEHHKLQAAERLKAGALWQDHGLVFASSIGTPLDRHNMLREFRKITEADLG
jgi:predicted nucleic acid-binding protein